jgi:elongator complex protein 3
LRLQIKDLRLVKREYKASGARETFLSFEDTKQNKILAFLRLRLPTNYELKRIANILLVLKDAAIIRELHTYGELVEIGKNKKMASQHKNLGKKLVKTAEQLAKKSGYKKMAVISGIGARPYWQKLGYKLQQTYMVKVI